MTGDDAQLSLDALLAVAHLHSRERHGLSATPTYSSWAHMIQRCTDQNCSNYPSYGGAGITVDEAWLSFVVFRADMGDRPPGTTLDRIDNSKGYSKSNCRWATVTEQNRNRSNVRLTIETARTIRARVAAGEAKRRIARELGIDPARVRQICHGIAWRDPDPPKRDAASNTRQCGGRRGDADRPIDSDDGSTADGKRGAP